MEREGIETRKGTGEGRGERREKGRKGEVQFRHFFFSTSPGTDRDDKNKIKIDKTN